jgi:hypothetical protein
MRARRDRTKPQRPVHGYEHGWRHRWDKIEEHRRYKEALVHCDMNGPFKVIYGTQHLWVTPVEHLVRKVLGD